MSPSCYWCKQTGAKSCEPHCGLCQEHNEPIGIPNGMKESDYELDN